jgi:hypothetical protein
VRGAATASARPSSAVAPSASTAVGIDPGLLEVLPGAVDGLDLEYAPEATTETAADPSLAQTVEAIAYAIAATPDGSELVVAAVTRPKAGLFGDAFYRDWRASFDDGVCSQAGGVMGRDELEIGGRPVHTAACQGGVTVYHTYLGTPGVLVSVWAVGERGLGEKLMAMLRQ